jgi:hypothetical protein
MKEPIAIVVKRRRRPDNLNVAPHSQGASGAVRCQIGRHRAAARAADHLGHAGGRLYTPQRDRRAPQCPEGRNR